VWPRGWVEVYLYSSMTAALEGGEWSAARPGHTLPPGKTRYPLYKRLGGPVWTGRKSHPHRDSIPDRPARSQSLYRLSYPAHIYIYIYIVISTYVMIVSITQGTFQKRYARLNLPVANSSNYIVRKKNVVNPSHRQLR